MQTDIQARGFTLTEALRTAAQGAADVYAEQFPSLQISVQVRLFDINGLRGGVDKGCLVSAHIGHNRKVIVANQLDTDLYRAIPAAFAKLSRATRSALGRERTWKRTSLAQAF
jgi:putative sigma-54 modulation protein